MSNQTARNHRNLLWLAVAAIALALGSSGAFGQTFTWNGGGGDNNFGTGNNWGGSAPGIGSGVTLNFSGTVRPTPFNNYGAFNDFGSWFLTSGATNFIITGSSIGLWSKIENDSTNFFGLGISNISARAAIQINPVNGNLTVSNSSVGGSIFLDNNVSLAVWGDNINPSRTLTLDTILSKGNGTGGNGSLVVNQKATVVLLQPNTFGATTINSGTVQVGNGGLAGSLGDNTVTGTAGLANLAFNRTDTVASPYSAFNTILNTAIAVNSGAVSLTGAADNGGTSATVNNGGTLILAKTSSSTVHALGGVSPINSGGTVKLGGTGSDQVWTGAGFTVNSGGLLDMAGLNEGFDQLTGAGVVSNSVAATSTLTLGENGGSPTFSGIIQDGTLSGAKIALTKTGAGTLTLGGANSYSGGTTISVGKLNVSADNNLGGSSGSVTLGAGTLHGTASFGLAGTRALTVTGAGTFQVDGSTILTLNNGFANSAAAGAAAMNLSGGGTLSVKGNVSIVNNNSVTVNNATLEVDPGSAGTFNTAGKFILNNSSSTVAMNFKSGTGNFTAADFFVMADGSASAVSTLNVSGGTMNLNGPSTAMRLLLGNVGTANINVSGGALVVGAQPQIELGGDTQFSQNNGTATLTVSGTGSVTVNGSGIFELGRNSAGKTGAKGTINLWGGTLTSSRNIVNANGTSLINFSGGTLKAGLTSTTFLQGLTTATVSTNGGTIDTGGFNITIGQALLHDGSLAGADGGLIKTNLGTLTLAAANTYNGGTSLKAGTLNISADNNLGASTGGVTLGGGTLHSTANMGLASTRSVTFTNAGTFAVDPSTTLTLSNGFSNASATGGAAMTLNGGGTLSLKGNVSVANDNSLTVNAATLEIDPGGGGTFNTAGKFTLANASSSTVVMNLKSGSVTMTGPDFFAMADGSTTAVSTLNLLGGTMNLNMTGGQRVLIANQGTATINVSSGSLVVGANPQIELGGDIQFSANNASGTLTISGTGAMTVNGGGVFELGRNSAGKTGAKGTLNLWGGTLTSSRSITGADGTSLLNLSGGTLIAGAANSAWLQSLTAANVSTNGAIIDTATFAVTIPQALQHDTNVISADGGLTKLNSGTLTLTGSNSYTGPTFVNAGSLVVNGSLGTTRVAVTNSATLLGTGTINGPVAIFSAASLQPGSNATSIGTLTISNTLSLAGNTLMLVNRTNSPNASLIQGVSTLTNGGTLTVTNPGPDLQFGDTFTLFAAGAYSGSFAAFSLPPLNAGLAWDKTQLAVNGSISVEHAPTAADMSAGVVANQLLRISNAKLLSRCSDPDGDPLSILSAGPTSTNGGTVSLTSTNITYLSATNFVGGDRFSYTVSDGRGGTATANVFVTVTSPDAASANIVTPPAMLPNGHFHVGFAGIPGYGYTIQYSPNATGPWTTFTNLTAGTNGLFDLEDPTEPPPATRFYRTVYP